jgi:pyruvate kinase
MPHTVPQHTRTKIVATLGPATQGHSKLMELIRAGVNVFRINMAHGDRASHDEALDSVRAAAAELGRPLGVLIDLAGPKIRLGELVQSPMDCELEHHFHFIRSGARAQHDHELESTYEPLVDELSIGDQVLLADGAVAMEVIEKQSDRAICRVVEPGVIKHRQGINLPGVALSTPSLTAHDRDNAIWAARRRVDFVGLSFVRAADEVRELRRIIAAEGGNADVVAKIEKAEAVKSLAEIVDAADAVMVARGDLGVEIDVAETPIAQKRIIDMCTKLRRPVIVATQMLDSMQHSRRPTRAEASDVANAILDGADACMLSGETAVGEYPVETVMMMRRIMRATELLLQTQRGATPLPPTVDELGVHPITSAVAYGAGRIAERLGAKLVVIASRSGQTARVKAKQREYVPTVGVSNSEETLRKMTLYWGIIPLPEAPVREGQNLAEFVEEWAKNQNLVHAGDRIVLVTGTNIVPHVHNSLIVHEVSRA